MRRLLSGGPAALLLSVGLLLAGCLPSSSRENDRSVSASDSASVTLAETVEADTLALAWEAASPADTPMPLPTTIAWVRPDAGDSARIAVVETQQGSIRLFTPTGAYAGRVETGGGEESFPYLAGVRGDTVVVFERGSDALAFVPVGGGAVRRISIPTGATAALATDSTLWIRTGGGPDKTPAFLIRLDERGRAVERHAFSGSPWRATGFLREWTGDVVALSGYRPVVDLHRRGSAAGARLDTLALTGFSSPELSRSAQFMRGDVDEPPLLTSSAAALGADLYVLNLRDEHVRFDVYGADGRIQRTLVSPGPWASLPYFPVDVAARRAGAQREFAVLMQRPSGIIQQADSRVYLYRWTPPTAPASVSAPAAPPTAPR